MQPLTSIRQEGQEQGITVLNPYVYTQRRREDQSRVTSEQPGSAASVWDGPRASQKGESDTPPLPCRMDRKLYQAWTELLNVARSIDPAPGFEKAMTRATT